MSNISNIFKALAAPARRTILDELAPDVNWHEMPDEAISGWKSILHGG